MKRLSLLATILVIGLLLTANAQDKQSGKDEKLSQLRQQQIQALESAVKSLDALHIGNKVSFEAVLLARKKLLEARLANAQTDAEKQLYLQDMLKNARSFETMMKSRHEAGVETIANYQLARADRIDMEIQVHLATK